MNQQLSFFEPAAPPPPPPYTPTARELESITTAEAIVGLLLRLNETEAAAVGRGIVAQCRVNPALGRWAVHAADAQLLGADWPWTKPHRRTRLTHLQDMAREFDALLATRCPTCASDAVRIERFGWDEKIGEGQWRCHSDFLWLCRACKTRWKEGHTAFRQRAGLKVPGA